MKQERFIMISEFDKLPISVLVCLPDDTPKAILQISHGMCEHKERYLHFMKYLCSQGYICVIHDHRGHGDSVKDPDDLGYFNQNGEKGIVKDVYQLNRFMKERYPDLKYFLLGHSMGSLIVRVYAKKYDDTIDGLIVCGSPSENKGASLGILLTRIIGKVRGDHVRVNVLQNMAFKDYNKNTEKITEADWICSNQEIVQIYEKDPYCNYIFTVNGFRCLFLLMREAYSRKGWLNRNRDLPIWFISGNEDPCMGDVEKFHQAVRRMKEVGYQDVQAKIYDKMRHEIINETERMLVYKDILDRLDNWLI
ncbi:MAG TPA: alpha/beta fold hydrolase [Lachnospiraceae bacterium]|nr:alpha/beta fold hydrolase [Lachnospiraceae bacterium]